MATTINADDGVISGSAGLKTEADASGELALQTNGTTAVTVTANSLAIRGYTSNIPADDAGGSPRTTWGYQTHSTAVSGAGYLATYWANNEVGPGGLTVGKSRGASIGTRAIVQDGDELGQIGFVGDDGTNFISAAGIFAYVDGAPGTNDMPGRLVFKTAADGASSPTERLRIDSAGDIDMAATSSLQKNSINAYTLKNITYLTSGTAATYTTPTGVRALKVTTIGGGGGGGGVDGSSTASTVAYSDGGGGAGYAIAFITSVEASYVYTVGSGGTGGVAGNNAGAAGGDSIFRNSGSTVVITGGGGGGGVGDAATTSTAAYVGTPGVGSITGLGSPGGMIGKGTGFNGFGRVISGAVNSLAGSGFCPIVGGGIVSATAATGTNASIYGEGGSGVRTSAAVATNFAGGNGFQGIIIVEEYY